MATPEHNRPASHWERLKDNKVQCFLCPFHCSISPGGKGICRVKQNVNGELIATAYGHTTALNIDPIEKKPLYHFYPGRNILSVGPNACNLKCQFCQNYSISQLDAPTRYFSPRELAEMAGERGSVGIAYTYTEPLMWFEYLMDTMPLVKEGGGRNVVVSNGHIEQKPLRELLPFTDAFNIDIKSMDEVFYKKVCKGRLGPVLKAVETMAQKSHVEITNLVIPGLNDDDKNMEKLAGFMADIDPLMPLHISRYHPDYKLKVPATPVETLLRVREIALEKLKYVYIGNVMIPGGNNTFCPWCDKLLVERDYSATSLNVEDGKCLACGENVNIIC